MYVQCIYILNQRLLEIKALVETRYVTKTHTHMHAVCVRQMTEYLMPVF